jgi:hypothetical protein
MFLRDTVNYEKSDYHWEGTFRNRGGVESQGLADMSYDGNYAKKVEQPFIGMIFRN